MKIYIGTKKKNSNIKIMVKDTETKSTRYLWPERSQAITNHSPDGFNWGYNGSGPAQTALAILLDLLPESALALHYYQQFKQDIVSKWEDKFKITQDEIEKWIYKNNITKK